MSGQIDGQVGGVKRETVCRGPAVCPPARLTGFPTNSALFACLKWKNS
jgi:hypothetical protein